jgi:ATP/ADP translocase
MNQPLGHASPVDARVKDRARLLAMMALFFLVVCAVGILRPIKNSLALDGLGSTSFYKVYLVSAIVILFVPLFNRRRTGCRGAGCCRAWRSSSRSTWWSSG